MNHAKTISFCRYPNTDVSKSIKKKLSSLFSYVVIGYNLLSVIMPSDDWPVLKMLLPEPITYDFVNGNKPCANMAIFHHSSHVV